MTTEVPGGGVVLAYQTVAPNPLWRMLSDKMTVALSELMPATSPRGLRSRINRLLPDYASVRSVTGILLSKEATHQGLTSNELVVSINQAAFAILEQGGNQFLSCKDAHIILAVMREEANFTELAENIPPENQPALYKALIEGYWTRHKLDMVISAALLIIVGDLQPVRRETTHWLCLAARQFLSEWESILFANNPVLRGRLSTPIEDLETVTLDEWEKELGL